MTHKIFLVLASALCSASAPAAPLPWNLSVSSDLTFASEYIFRGIERADYSFQPTVELAGGDFYGGLWGNVPTGNEETEFHYYGGRSFRIPGIEFATLDSGLTVYHFPNSGSRRTHELHFGSDFSFPDAPAFGTSLFYYYDLDVKSHVSEATVSYSYSLERIGLPATLDFSLLGGVQGGSRVKTESYNYFGGSVELPLILSDHSILTTGLHYGSAEDVTFEPGERGNNFYWTIGYLTFF